LPSVHFSSGGNGSGSALALPLVAMTLKKVQANRELTNQLFIPFPEIAPELASELNCPDFKEKKVLDNFFRLFKRDKNHFETQTHPPVHKKESFLQRIFGKRNRRNPR
jgi:penicillin-binding protein 1A